MELGFTILPPSEHRFPPFMKVIMTTDNKMCQTLDCTDSFLDNYFSLAVSKSYQSSLGKIFEIFFYNCIQKKKKLESKSAGILIIALGILESLFLH